jgi:molybdopterin-guanine dinucleotide biosynthesis protein A
MSAPIYGLVLAGGTSSRMRTDKAALLYEGQTQLQRAVSLLSRHAKKVFVSVRPSQTADPLRSSQPMIVDAVPGEGPMAGIRSAMQAHPEAAWLVIACDLPFLSDPVLEHLIANRHPQAPATAYRSAHDGLPEPLCAIWEPHAAAKLAAYQADGGRCPRKFLIRSDAPLIEPVNARALDNINTPEEYTEAIGGGGSAKNTGTMRLNIQYFALMREQANMSRESVETKAATAAELFAELAQKHGFTLSRDQLKVAINSEFGSWTQPLREGDSVVFIPPVAGG